MAKKISSIKIDAETWLKKQLEKESFVFQKGDIEKSTLDYLTQEQVIAELNNHYVFIKSNQELATNAFTNNLWLLIFQYLNCAFDEEWYLTGYYAYNFAVDNFSSPNKQITVSTKKKSNTIIELPVAIKIIASYDVNYNEKPVLIRTFFETQFNQLKPEYLIINSTENEYRTYKDEIVSLLKSTERDEKFIINFFTDNNSPVLLARLIGALRVIEDLNLRIELEAMFKLSRAKIAIKNPFGEVTLTKSIERPSYLNRFELSMIKAIETLRKIKKPRKLTKKIAAKDLDEIIVEDTYHSLTIEGYTVTRALIEYLKNEKNDTSVDVMDLRSKLAAKGFMSALGYIKRLINSSYNINEQLSKKLFEELWKPSYNAASISHEFDIYRKHMVAIKGASYVPPSHEKVPYLIDEVFEAAKGIDNGFELGIFMHYFYVGVHPHTDGNGRISRFLMNLAFIKDKYKWLTIPSEDRRNYFAALEKSQLTDDISYFAKYIMRQYSA